MKIALVNDYGFILGGAETYFFNLARSLQNAGHQVITISSDRMRGNREFLTDYQIPHSGHFFNLDSFFNPKSYQALKNIVNKEDIELVHFNNVFYQLSPSVLLVDCPSVITAHDYYSVCNVDKTKCGRVCNLAFKDCCSKDSLSLRIKKKIIQKFLKKTKKVICPSQYIESVLNQNGIENTAYVPHPIFEEEKGFFPEEKIRKNQFVFLGRLEEQKGLEYLIKSAKELSQKRTDFSILIAGDGSKREFLENLTEDLGLKENIKFLGWIAGEEKKRIIEESLAIVVPSIWPEVSGLVLYEAAACGTPAIAFDVGAIHEFVRHKETGLLSKVKDTSELALNLAYALENAEQILEMGKKARTLAKNLNCNSHLENLMTLYGM